MSPQESLRINRNSHRRRRRAVATLLGLALFGGSAQAADGPTTHATTKDGGAVIDGQKRLLIGGGWLAIDHIDDGLRAGFSDFISRRPGTRQVDFAKAVGKRGTVIAEFSPKIDNDTKNTIGKYLEDEPDEHSISRLPQIKQAGRLAVVTLTKGFMDNQPKPAGITMDHYKGYIRDTDATLASVYPEAFGCTDKNLSVSTVYDAVVQLRLLSPPDHVSGVWLNAGPIFGQCERPEPERVGAEAMSAAAAGAGAYFYFTYSKINGVENDYDVTPEMQETMAATNHELRRYQDVILAPRLDDINSAPDDPLKVGVREQAGRYCLILANVSDNYVSLEDDQPANSWENRLPELSNQSLTDLGSGQSIQSSGGRFKLTVQPYGHRILCYAADKRKQPSS